MPVARWLRVDEPLASKPKFSLEIERTGQAQGETREVEVLPNMAAVGRTVADLGVPRNVLILLIGRGEDFVVPRGQTVIEPYDTLLMLGDAAALKEASEVLVSPHVRVRDAVPADDPLAALPMSTEERYLSKQVVVIGYGRVGRRICEALWMKGIPVVVVDQDREKIELLRDKGAPAVVGDASIPMTLVQAHVARAAMLIIATPDTMKVRQMAETARQLNSGIDVVVRTHSEMEASLLQQEETGDIFLGEEELAKNMVAHILDRMRAKN